ncbi:hypothetical protein PIB30_021901 [Stylosanthes scabra]|uniref:SWIM-type domain-containing protein n=1 Tax=Stylosanthes scabra TaxID=79078 RepID=A0ABU6S927_9FABA|nr:hypothetical protein [Stylosanthes scabra]
MIGAGKNGHPGKYERWLSGASTGPMQVEPSCSVCWLVLRGACLHLVLVLLLRIGTVDALSSTGSDLSWVVEAWGVTLVLGVMKWGGAGTPSGSRGRAILRARARGRR